MNIEEIRTYCLSFRGATEDSAFGPNTVLFRLCNKIFACIDLSRPNLVVLKTTEEEATMLRERFRGITGAWHWNKHYWNDVYLDSDVEEAQIRQLLEASYDLVRQKLPKKTLYNFPDIPSGWKHEHYPVLDSAMNLIKTAEVQHDKSEFLLITTDFQTAGRGQGKNTWEAEDGKNLLFAFRFFPTQVKAVDQFQLLQCISLAVAEALERYLKDGVKIKWPNDIYYKDKKICGILIEHDLCGQFLTQTRCGIGINVNQQHFFSSAPNPASLCQLLGKEVDRASVLRCFIQHFMHSYQELLNGHAELLFHDYLERLYRLHGWYPYRDAHGYFEAVVQTVENDGSLVLKDRKRNLRKYAHKEVEFILCKTESESSIVDRINSVDKQNE